MSENPLAGDLDHVLDHTRDLWDELRGERVFITGGTGFFGCWLLESLLWAQDRLGLGVEAVVLTRDPDAFRARAPHLASHPALTLLAGDVRSVPFPAGTFSHFIHAATDASAKLNDREPRGACWTRSSTALVTPSTTPSPARPRRFLLTSSGAVSGASRPR